MAPARERHHSTGCNHHDPTIHTGGYLHVHALLRFMRWPVTRLPMLIAAGLVGRAWHAWRRRTRHIAGKRQVERSVLPSIYDRYPGATSAPRRRVGVTTVALDRIVGTMRHPSQNTADFLPLPRLRGENWRARWQRITKAMDKLATLPPVDLVQVGDEYFVADGHNRVAAARDAGGIEIDADVTQLVMPGIETAGQATHDTGWIADGQEVRMAGQGRHSRTVASRLSGESVSRRDLLRDPTEERS
jgi:hypothetical protein